MAYIARVSKSNKFRRLAAREGFVAHRDDETGKFYYSRNDNSDTFSKKNYPTELKAWKAACTENSLLPLSPKTIKKYLKRPTRCPYCGNTEIEADGNVEVDGETATQEVHCNAKGCGRDWLDIYTLTGIQEA